MMVHKGSLKVSLSGGSPPKLTSAESEVLYLLTKEFLTVQQVAIRRKTTTRAVYNIRKRLIEKGVLNIVNQAISPVEIKVHKTGGVSNEYEHPIRLHGEQYHIKIIQCDDRYRKLVSQGSKKIEIEGNTIMCYRNTVEIYSNSSFFGKSPNECDSKALSYWSRFIVRLEQEIKCILMKRSHMNISRVKAEYAETNNEIAKTAIKEHDKVRVVGEDGKVWLIVDNSFNFNECETVHPKNSKQDMQDTVQPFFNDLRENEYIPLSELSQIMTKMSKNLNELTHAVKANAMTINTLLKMMGSSGSDQQLHTSTQREKRPDYLG
jgi:DNA-binding CsgD family transcriptional regulator